MTSPAALMTDFDVLTMLTSSSPPSFKHKTAIGIANNRYKRREAPLDPLLLAAAISSGPHVTRHHYHHHQPSIQEVEGLLASSSTNDASSSQPNPTGADAPKPKYQSQQAPRSERLKQKEEAQHNENQREPLGVVANLPRRPRGPSLLQPIFAEPAKTSSNVIGAGPPAPSPFVLSSSPSTLSPPIIRHLPPAPLQVQCMARTRIPTPHGPVFLHLYRNNKDMKEHLAFVADPDQLRDDYTIDTHSIRSASLEARWSDDETDLDRLARGAYVGRLTPTTQRASEPGLSTSSSDNVLPPLVRIHSECFTGETIGSMRCDCGEQLDEALRLISLPRSSTSPGRGAVIYLRQEGRGIGLLSKIRAYNLQDMGHDTVQANLLLGHGADERRYDIAAAIMRDLGLDSGVELLTNNPDKVKSLEVEGIKVLKRREMVPRSWQQNREHVHVAGDNHDARVAGATLIGGGITYGPELEKYLRTKVERMGHMLELPPQ